MTGTSALDPSPREWPPSPPPLPPPQRLPVGQLLYATNDGSARLSSPQSFHTLSSEGRREPLSRKVPDSSSDTRRESAVRTSRSDRSLAGGGGQLDKQAEPSPYRFNPDERGFFSFDERKGATGNSVDIPDTVSKQRENEGCDDGYSAEEDPARFIASLGIKRSVLSHPHLSIEAQLRGDPLFPLMQILFFFTKCIHLLRRGAGTY